MPEQGGCLVGHCASKVRGELDDKMVISHYITIIPLAGRLVGWLVNLTPGEDL